MHEEDLEELIFAGTDWQDDTPVGGGLGALGGLRELGIDFQVSLTLAAVPASRDEGCAGSVLR